jgi:hypothetical protein
MGLKATAYRGFDTIPNSNRYAIEYGPILLALTGKKEAPHVITGTSNLTNGLVPDATTPLHFLFSNNADYQFVPYWQLEPHQNFTVFPIVKADAGSKSNTSIKSNLQWTNKAGDTGTQQQVCKSRAEKYILNQLTSMNDSK